MFSDDTVLCVEGISKCFEMYDKPIHRLYQTLCAGYRNFFKEFWALREVSFQIRRGECVGIVGRNGAGKSTLLQIITGTLLPTAGTVRTQGKIAALLELGSGFNPEFTGKENIYLNATIMGLSRQEITERYQDIIDFADIGEFINQPIKTYSSGMMARLAFSTQIMLEPDILIIDEALAVGDHFFQAKCYAYLKKLKEKGTTILFVSHSPATVQSLCEKSILLDKGRLIALGNSSDVLDRYFKLAVSRSAVESMGGKNTANTSISYGSTLQPPFAKRYVERLGNGLAEFQDCYLIDESGQEITASESGQYCNICAILEVREPITEPSEIGITVNTLQGIGLFSINSYFLKMDPVTFSKPGRYLIQYSFRQQLSHLEKYRIDLGFRSPVQGEYVDKVLGACIFTVTQPAERTIPLLFDVPGKIEIRNLKNDVI